MNTKNPLEDNYKGFRDDAVFNRHWSFSGLMVFESCKYRFRLKFIDRIPELPPKPDSPLERGSRIHDHLEGYVKGEQHNINCEAREIDKFQAPLERLRELYACNMATAEQDWFADKDWEMCERDGVWLWLKLDASVTDEATKRTIAIDYKSGKSQYKHFEHVQQLQLYSAVQAIKYPWASIHISELWYVDEGHIKTFEVSHDDAMRYIGRFDNRVQKIYNERLFPPSPNAVTCKWCPYGPKNGNGYCAVGV